VTTEVSRVMSRPQFRDHGSSMITTENVCISVAYRAIVRDQDAVVITEIERVVPRSICRDHVISMITADRWGRSTH
jgi:hypothetical protein